MMSGMRKAPPISISSPRETMASRPFASVLSTISTAAALLLTTVASSAPVSSHSSARKWSSRSPRLPLARSNSSDTALRIAATAASTASSAISARPRLVCSTVPVRLNTGRKFGCAAACSPVSALATASSTDNAMRAARAAPIAARTASATAVRPKRSIASVPAAERITSSTEGSLRKAAVPVAAIAQ